MNTLSTLWMFGMPGPFEMVMIFLVVLLLFGGKRLPDVARGIGEALKEFRKGVSGSDKDKPGSDSGPAKS